MNAESKALQAVMDSFTGGSEGRTRHVFNRRFIYTEGVKAVAEAAGTYWLLDIVATEVAPLAIKEWELFGIGMSFLSVEVKDSVAELSWALDVPGDTVWSRNIEFTDFPEGSWLFYLQMDGVVERGSEVLVMLLKEEY